MQDSVKTNDSNLNGGDVMRDLTNVEKLPAVLDSRVVVKKLNEIRKVQGQVDKLHLTFLRDLDVEIEKFLKEKGNTDMYMGINMEVFTNPNGTRSHVMMCEDTADMMISRESPLVRIVMKRELRKALSQPKVESAKPKTVEASLEETCKLCADLTFEEVQQLANKLVRSVHTKKLQDVHGSYAYYYEYWKSVSENTTFSMLEVSKELGLGRTTFMSLLRSEGILLADARIPAQRFVDEGKVIVVRTAWFDKRGNPHEEYVTRFTVKGRELMIKGVYDRIRKRHDGDIKAFKEELKIRLKDRMLDLPNDSTFLPDFDATHEQLVNNILPREKFIANSLK